MSLNCFASAASCFDTLRLPKARQCETEYRSALLRFGVLFVRKTMRKEVLGEQTNLMSLLLILWKVDVILSR